MLTPRCSAVAYSVGSPYRDSNPVLYASGDQPAVPLGPGGRSDPQQDLRTGTHSVLTIYHKGTVNSGPRQSHQGLGRLSRWSDLGVGVALRAFAFSLFASFGY